MSPDRAPVRVLMVEDREDHAELIVETLRRAGLPVAADRVDDAPGLARALDAGGAEVVIVDCSMPEFSGPEAIEMVRRRGLDLPCVVVSATVGEERAVAAEHLLRDEVRESARDQQRREPTDARSTAPRDDEHPGEGPPQHAAVGEARELRPESVDQRMRVAPVHEAPGRGIRSPNPARKDPGALHRDAEARAPAGIEYHLASAVELPFAAGHFDFATGFMSFMGIPEMERVVSEAHRVLRRGGFLQFSIAHPCFDTPHRKNLRDAHGTTYAIEVGEYFHNLRGRIDEWTFKTAPPANLSGIGE